MQRAVNLTQTFWMWQNTSEFRIELEGGSFADIPKEFNMRPHAGSSQSMYSFSEDTGYVSES